LFCIVLVQVSSQVIYCLFVGWLVGWLVANRGSPVVVFLYYARASFSLGDLLLLFCLLAEVLLLLLFCVMFAYMYHPKLWCDPLLLACLQTFSCCSEWISCVYRRNRCSSVACRGSWPIVILYDVPTIVPSGLLLLAELVLLSFFLYDTPACIFPWSDLLLLADVLLFSLIYVYVKWYVVIYVSYVFMVWYVVIYVYAHGSASLFLIVVM
jgi:hypothetical protein